MDDDFKQAGGEWREYKLGNLFTFQSIKQAKSQKEIPTDNSSAGVNYIVQSMFNNMFSRKVNRQYLIEHNEAPVSGNRIVLGVTLPAVSYQEHEFGASQVITATSDWLTREIGLFIVPFLQRQMYQFSYGNKPGLQIYKDMLISLPTLNNNIAFSYMETYIKTLEAYLTVTGLKDYHLTEKDEQTLDTFAKLSDTESREEHLGTYAQYELQSLFKWGDKISELNPLHLDSLEDLTQPAYPFYGQATINNGIISYRQLTKTVLNNEQSLPTLLIHSNNQNIVYLETPFYLKDGHGATSVLQSDNLNRYTAFYLMTAINKVIEKRFNYNAKATKIGLKLTEITLPTVNEKVNYDFMSDLIRAVEKLVIKDLVEWTDKKIAATREVVAR